MITIRVSDENELRMVLHALRHEWLADFSHGKPDDISVQFDLGSRAESSKRFTGDVSKFEQQDQKPEKATAGSKG